MAHQKLTADQARRVEEIEEFQRATDHLKRLVTELESNRAGQTRTIQQLSEKIANEARGEDRNAARKLDDAAGSITDKRIREMIRYTRQALQAAPGTSIGSVEAQIGANLDGLEKKIADAASAFGQTAKQDAMSKALEQARNLVRRGESLDQQMRDRVSNT